MSHDLLLQMAYSEKTAHVTSTLIVLDFPGKLHLQRTEDVESI